MPKVTASKKELVELLAYIDDMQAILLFLSDLLTKSEYEELGKRLQIIKMLDAGFSQREIVEKLGVGIATVTRGSAMMKNQKGGFRHILDTYYE